MSTELTVIPTATLMPVMSIQQAAERHNILVEYTKSVMVKDQDFGIIPGVSKPCLYKAGAEKLLSLFGFSPSFSLIERVEDWIGKDHGGEPFFYYFYKCQLLRGGEILGEGDGSCNSWEKKYRYRSGERKCPQCGKPAIIVGKPEYGGGFICFAKKGGCGAKFGSKDPAIIGQDTGQVPNPDIAEQVNTLQKMAQKRSLVAAVLIACNASSFYTQDVEDMQTIEVTPTETRDEIVERRIAELKKLEHGPVFPSAELQNLGKYSTSAQMNPDPLPSLPPETIIELADQLNGPPAEPPILAPPVKKPARKTTPKNEMTEAAKMKWRQAKMQLRAVTGDDKAYYGALAPYKHCTEIATKEEAAAIWKALQAALVPPGPPTPKGDPPLLLELQTYKHRFGDEEFFRILGLNGFESIEDFMVNANGLQTDTLLWDLKDRSRPQ